MENVIGRRDFLKFGTAMAAGLSMGMIPAGCAENARSDDAESFSPIKYSFLIDENNFSKINSETQIVESLTPIAAYGLDIKELHRPIMFDSSLIEKASQEKEALLCTDSEKTLASIVPVDSTLSLALGVQANGFSEMIDVAADSISSILQYGKLDLGMDFFHQDLFLGKALAKQGFNTLEKVEYHTDLFGWFFQVRGPDFDPLGSCDRRKISHVHLEIGKKDYRGKVNKIANFHLGAYKDGKKRCFVLWNNIRPHNICWKSCNANKKTLTEMMKWVIISVAAALGIYLSAFIIAAIAEALGVALIPVLAALAI
ncbi:MAG: hypothetical protein WCI36_02780 [bacterium]